ncbi:MAG: uracil-DNA glycosylase family protein [Bacteroidota bacterium]
MTFSESILAFHRQLKPDWKLPEGVELLFPFDKAETWSVMEAFFQKYYSSSNTRTLIFGINPGRFGAGITGTPFTDPKILEEVCGIKNPFKKRSELSAIFVYDFINAFGGPDTFYQQFYITSLCPLGFVKEGKNYNYYDSKALTKAVEPYILHNIRYHLEIGCNTDVAFSLGKGKNFAYFQQINKEKKFFKKVVPLPHPRWVMQYRLKRKAEFVQLVVDSLNKETA